MGSWLCSSSRAACSQSVQWCGRWRLRWWDSVECGMRKMVERYRMNPRSVCSVWQGLTSEIEWMKLECLLIMCRWRRLRCRCECAADECMLSWCCLWWWFRLRQHPRVDYVRRLASAPNSHHSMHSVCFCPPSECGGREAMGWCTVLRCRMMVGHGHFTQRRVEELASNRMNGGSPDNTIQ